MRIVARGAAQFAATLLEAAARMHLLDLTHGSCGRTCRVDPVSSDERRPDIAQPVSWPKIKLGPAVTQYPFHPLNMTLIAKHPLDVAGKV